jgi:hypothetical protein
MVIATTEPGWLHTAAQAAGTLLLLELFVALFIILVLMVVLATAAWWIKGKLVPVLRQYAPRAEQVMSTTLQGTDRVVQSVAEFYGRRQQIETSIRVLLFGSGAAKRVHENALVQAATDLDLMTPAQESASPENGGMPESRARGREVSAAADRPPAPPARARPEQGGAGARNGGSPIPLRPHPAARSRRDTGDDHGNVGPIAGSAG